MIGIVVIGRNEGERLRRCLESCRREAVDILYVDSGSRDGSVALARGLGVDVLELDMTRPFSAARARNAGAAALIARRPRTELIQFVDGDCELVEGWIAAAAAALEIEPALGIVTGWRAERRPEASIYNALCDIEWHRPAGEIESCGGDMMVRRSVYEMLDGFDATVIAAEDDEFCVRVRRAGHRIRRLPLPMTSHDAAITSFRQWWRRAVRAGHGFAQVGAMHRGVFAAERRRVLFYGLALPMGAAAGSLLTLWAPALAAAVYALSFAKTAAGLRRLASGRLLPALAGLLTLSKFPNLIGMATYYRRAWFGPSFHLIEYK